MNSVAALKELSKNVKINNAQKTVNYVRNVMSFIQLIATKIVKLKNVTKNAITSVANVFSVMNHIWIAVDISVCSAPGKTKNFQPMGLSQSLHREKLVNHPMSWPMLAKKQSTDDS